MVPEPDQRRILRIGHRGAAGYAPENTIAAIRKGIALGADFVEVDVRRTRDGHLVLLHDELVDRTTDGRGPVSQMTWQELQRLDGRESERVPSVEAALAAAAGRAGMMLEIKVPGIAAELCRLVQQSGFPGPVIYASFLQAEIAEIRQIAPGARTMALIEGIPVSGATFARNGSATMVGLAHDFATAECIATLHRAGLEVWLYTVNDPPLIRRAIDIGADGVISDFPDRVPPTRLSFQ